MKTQQKLIKFEKYLRRQRIISYVKKNILFRFHEIFMEEMKGTETGDKFREKLGWKFPWEIKPIKFQRKCLGVRH